MRHLADLALMDKALRLHLRIRRFFCDNPACPKRTFAEQPAGLAAYKARRTERQQKILRTIAFAEGGRPGLEQQLNRVLRLVRIRYLG